MTAAPLALCMISLTSIGYFWCHKLRMLHPGVRPPAIGWVHKPLFAVGALKVGSISKGVVSVGALSIWGISEVLVVAGHLSKRVYSTFFLKK